MCLKYALGINRDEAGVCVYYLFSRDCFIFIDVDTNNKGF